MGKARQWLLLVILLLGMFSVARAQDNRPVHIIREGETLTSIATRYGVSVDALVAANKLSDPNAIVVGQSLVIPINSGSANASNAAQSQGRAQTPATSAPGTYTVQRGDTLIGIAGQLGVSVDDLMATNHITDPSVVRIGQVLKIPGESTQPQADSVAVAALPDGQYTLTPSAKGPSVNIQVSGGRLVAATLQTVSSGKQSLPLSCEAKIASQIAMMYGLTFDEASFQDRLPHSLNPRRGFVGSVQGRFYWPRDVIGGNAYGPGGYGVHVEGWVPTFQALSGFQTRLLSSSPTSAQSQIDAALRRGYPVAVWAVLGFRAQLSQNGVWVGTAADGTAIECAGPGGNCSYLVSGEHAYLIVGRQGDDYQIYDPGSGDIANFSRRIVIGGITTLFAGPTGSAPGAVIVPSAGHVPDLRQVPDW